MGTCICKRKASLTALHIANLPSQRLQFDRPRQGRSSVSNYRHVIALWNTYLDKSDISHFNVFTSGVLTDNITINVFKLNIDPIEQNMVFARHLHLVHFALDHCLKMILDREFDQCVMSLSSLGSIHADLGVTPNLMVSFARSAVSAIREANAVGHMAATNQDYEMLRDAIIAVTHAMVNGIKHHNNKISYVYGHRECRCGCQWCLCRSRKLKYIDKRSHKSIRNLSEMMLESD